MLLCINASPKRVKKKQEKVITEQCETPGQYKQRMSLSVGQAVWLEHFDGFPPTLLKYGQPSTSISQNITLAPWFQYCHKEL